jgi:OmpA-OmpF porin, OOP family
VQTNQQDIKANAAGVQANAQGVQQVQGEQAALTKRFNELGDYDVKNEVTVYFAINSTELSEQSKLELKRLSTIATPLKGYMIQVAGYTDSSGNAALNQELSDRRAEAVINYLQQSCGVPLFRVLAPAAMGVSNPAASNETQQGKAENRRVVAKVLVNRGMAG